jgi:predicted dienelactone hydrolase
MGMADFGSRSESAVAGRAPASRMRRLLAEAACLTSLLCAPAGPAWAYPVGHTTITFTDPERANRQIQTEIYYPAETAGEDVPVAPPPAGGFAVVAFGHGYLMGWDSYAYLWEALAPAGYVVALPRTEGGMLPDHAAFGADLAFLVRGMRAEGENPGSLFFGKIAAAAAVAGHSMGGGASFLAAQTESTVTALFNLAAAETNPSAISAAASIALPALLFSGSYDCVTPPAQHQEPMYDALASACRTWVTITGGSHCQFAESNFFCNLGEGSCSDPLISRSTQQALVIQLLVPWLDHALGGQPEAWAEFQDLLAMLSGIAHQQDCEIGAVDEPGSWSAQATAIRLGMPRPNPFRDESYLEYCLPRPGFALLEVHDPSGRRVRTLVAGQRPGGWQRVPWDGRDGQGNPLPAGTYWCRLRAGGEQRAVAWLRLR